MDVSNILVVGCFMLIECAFVSIAGPQIACVMGFEENGTTVVDETIRIIAESNIFADDFQLLRRTAWVDTFFGRQKTLVSGLSGDESGVSGFDDVEPRTVIWIMSNAQFVQTQDVDTYSVLTEKHQQIREQLLGIIWENVVYEDLSRPLYAAIAVCLYLSTLETPVPQLLRLQAQFWYESYHGIADDLEVSESAALFINFVLDESYPPPAANGVTGSKAFTASILFVNIIAHLFPVSRLCSWDC